MEMQDRIKAIRKHAGMTQAEFSTTLGLGPYSASAWEKKDAQVPTEPMQLLICKTFGIDLNWLKTGEGEMFAGKSAEDLAIESALRAAGDSPAIRALLVAYSRLNEHNRAVFEQFVEDYVAEYQASAAAARDTVANVVPVADLPGRRAPILGTSYNDGTVETKYAAMQEECELAADDSAIPVPDDPDLMAMRYQPADLPDSKIIR